MFLQWLWRMWKWFLRLFTGQCELERLCYQKQQPYQLALRIEGSLRRSRAAELRRLVEGTHTTDDAVDVIIRIKKIKQGSKCVPLLRSGVQLIVGVAGLVKEVRELKSQSFSKDDQHHESLLTELWDHMMPSEKLTSRVSSQWKELGFQGNDPATDFRGMGLFGLMCLHHLASCHGDLARQLLSHSHHPTVGYPYAIVGIDLSSFLWSMLEGCNLNPHLYQLATLISLQKFMDLFCDTMKEFDKFWQQEKPENLLAYPVVREKFVKHMSIKWKAQS